MKVLILSCNTGGGHNAAGRALYEEFHRRGIECEFLDTLSFARPKASKKASSIYVNITTKVPKLFQFFYNAGQWISSPHRKSVVYAFNCKYAAKLGDYIEEHQFDTIVMPHLFPAEALTYLKKNRSLHIRTYAVATDYTCIPFWEETNPDYFIIPHRELMREFYRAGIPHEKLIPLGIPVQRTFGVHRNQAEARQTLGLPEDGKMILIMSGSMGFGHMSPLIRSFLKKYKDTVTLVVMGGNNAQLKDSLREQFGEYKNVHILDFTTQVPLYMDSADLLYTKPGGLTSTESLVKGIPTIHTAPIPGCETKNARFFASHGLSYSAKSTREQIACGQLLIQNESAREAMQKAQSEHALPLAAENIYQFLLEQEKNK